MDKINQEAKKTANRVEISDRILPISKTCSTALIIVFLILLSWVPD
jgi:hypothetical protein